MNASTTFRSLLAYYWTFSSYIALIWICILAVLQGSSQQLTAVPKQIFITILRRIDAKPNGGVISVARMHSTARKCGDNTLHGQQTHKKKAAMQCTVFFTFLIVQSFVNTATQFWDVDLSG